MSDHVNKNDSFVSTSLCKLNKHTDSATVDRGLNPLEEINDYVHTDEEIAQYAESIGIDLKNEHALLDIAREGISAPLPEDWCALEDQNRKIIYQQISTGIQTLYHPLDELFKERVLIAKEKFHQSKNPCCIVNMKKSQRTISNSQQIQSILPTSSFNTSSIQEDDEKTTYLPFASPLSASGNKNMQKQSTLSSTFKAPASPTTSVGQRYRNSISRRLRTEHTLCSLQSNIHDAKQQQQNQNKNPKSTDCLTPADRLFLPKLVVNSHQRTEISLPRLQTSPSSSSQHRLIDEDYSDNENVRLRPLQSKTEEDNVLEMNDGVLSEQFANSLKLMDVDERKSTRSLLRAAPSPNGDSLERHRLEQCSPCQHHIKYEEGGGECISVDANDSLRYMLEERQRMQEKLSYLKLTYKAYKLRLAAMDSNIRQLCNPATSSRRDIHSGRPSTLQPPPASSGVSSRRSALNSFIGHTMDGNRLATTTPLVPRRSISASSNSRAQNRI